MARIGVASAVATAALLALTHTACETGADRPPVPDAGPAEADAPAGRPAEQRRVVQIEGMDEEMRVVLYRAPDGFPIPFSTYVPDDFVPEETASGEGDAVAFVARFGGYRNAEAAVRLIVAPPGMGREDMVAMLRTLTAGMGAGLSATDDRLFDWSELEFRIEPRPGRMEGIGGIAAVGERHGRSFVLIAHHPPEYGDGFAPRAGIILDEWEWKEHGPTRGR
jgi:hypothetical protein